MTSQVPRIDRPPTQPGWSVSRCCSVLALGLLATFAACNRAVPEKAENKSGESGDSDTKAQPPGILADKQSVSGQAVLPPDGNLASTPGPGVIDTPNIKVEGPPAPGVQIENPVSHAPAGETADNAPLDQRFAEASFMRLELPRVQRTPDQMLGFLMECDRAVQELSLAHKSEQISEKLYLEQAKRLSGIKLAASERLYADSTATVAQKKTSIAAQVESLSQLTGLGDVQAAQKLLRVAGDLAKSADPQLAHQGRLVLMGFRLNQLVEGQIKEPQAIVDDVNGILDNSQHRGLVELLALQQGLGVLLQLGYSEQAQKVQNRIVQEFRNSPEKEVAMRSWMIEVGSSAELKALNEAIQNTMTGIEKDPSKVASSATAFVNAYPSLNTLVYLSRFIVDLEYGGQIEASRQLQGVVAKSKSQQPSGPLLVEIDHVLDGHARRLSTLGQPLVLDQLTGMDGAPFDWSSYRNKVVLVFCWASWQRPSWELIDKVKALRDRIDDPSFEIIGICTDDGQTITDAEQMVIRQAFKYRNLRSSSAQAVGLESPTAKQLGVNAYSHFALLVDKKGTVRAIHPNFDNIDSMIQELITE